MIGSILERLGYVRYLFSRGAWRWAVDRVDYLVADHLKEWDRLERRPGTMVHPTVSLRHAANIELGANVRVQPYSILWASPNAKIIVGDDSGLGPGTMLFASNHQFKPGATYHSQPWVEKDIRIGRDVWVGAGSILTAGVVVGDGTVVAAGSVVTRDLPPGVVAGGVPARVIKGRE